MNEFESVLAPKAHLADALLVWALMHKHEAAIIQRSFVWPQPHPHADYDLHNGQAIVALLIPELMDNLPPLRFLVLGGDSLQLPNLNNVFESKNELVVIGEFYNGLHVSIDLLSISEWARVWAVDKLHELVGVAGCVITPLPNFQLPNEDLLVRK